MSEVYDLSLYFRSILFLLLTGRRTSAVKTMDTLGWLFQYCKALWILSRWSSLGQLLTLWDPQIPLAWTFTSTRCNLWNHSLKWLMVNGWWLPNMWTNCRVLQWILYCLIVFAFVMRMLVQAGECCRVWQPQVWALSGSLYFAVFCPFNPGNWWVELMAGVKCNRPEQAGLRWL